MPLAPAGFIGYGTLEEFPNYIDTLKTIALGRWKIDKAQNQLYLYDEDNATILKTFDLKDADGIPATSKIFERVPEDGPAPPPPPSGDTTPPTVTASNIDLPDDFTPIVNISATFSEPVTNISDSSVLVLALQDGDLSATRLAITTLATPTPSTLTINGQNLGSNPFSGWVIVILTNFIKDVNGNYMEDSFMFSQRIETSSSGS